MPDVFISYSRKDSVLVRQLHSALKAQNRNVWVDWEDIPFTADWWHEICAGIESSDTVVFVVSPASIESPVCNMELAHAREHHIRLVPIIAAAVDDKMSLANLLTRELNDHFKTMLVGHELGDIGRENWQAIARHHWLMFDQAEKFDPSFRALISAIETDLDYTRQHTRLLVRAREWDTKGRDSSYLLFGTDLHDAEQFMAQGVSKQPSLTPLHADYVLASQQNAQAEREKERRSQQRTRRYLQVLVGILGVLIGLLLFSTIITVQSYINVGSLIVNMSREIQDLTLYAIPIDGDSLSSLVTLGLEDRAAALQDSRYQSITASLSQLHDNFPNVVLSLDARDPQTGYRIPLFQQSGDTATYFNPQDEATLSLAPPSGDTFVTDEIGTHRSVQKPIYDLSGQLVGILNVRVVVTDNLPVVQSIVNYLVTLVIVLFVLAIIGISFGIFNLTNHVRRSSAQRHKS